MCPITSRLSVPKLLHPSTSDIVTVDEESFSWFLDRTTGRIIAEDVGGYRHSIARLRVEGEVRTACAVNGHVAFLDTAHPNAVQLQSLEPPFGVRSLPIAQRLLSGDVKKRDVLRFGGSPDGSCVLRSAHLPGVLVVSDSAVVALGPFVAGIESSEGPHASWRSRLASILGRGRDERVVNALDATSFPGGVAVLFAGRTLRRRGRASWLTKWSHTRLVRRWSQPHRRRRVWRQTHHGHRSNRSGTFCPDEQPLTARMGACRDRAPDDRRLHR